MQRTGMNIGNIYSLIHQRSTQREIWMVATYLYNSIVFTYTLRLSGRRNFQNSRIYYKN